MLKDPILESLSIDFVCIFVFFTGFLFHTFLVNDHLRLRIGNSSDFSFFGSEFENEKDFFLKLIISKLKLKLLFLFLKLLRLKWEVQLGSVTGSSVIVYSALWLADFIVFWLVEVINWVALYRAPWSLEETIYTISICIVVSNWNIY